jgi:hypothetical protein
MKTGNVLVPAGSSIGVRAREGHTLFTISLTLPAGVDVRDGWARPMLRNSSGVSAHRFIGSALSVSGDPKEPQRIDATFEIPKDHQPQTLIVGNYELDFVRGRVINRER